MTSYTYATLDVFTDRAFAGNPLAVVEDADDLTDDEMLAVAKEFGYSETVFLQPATRDGCDVRARIFTPGGELPFAGHPTIGTAVWLTRAGGSFAGATTLTLDELAGPVPLSIDAVTGVATLTAPQPPVVRDAPVEVAEVAAMLGLAADDLGALQLMSAGTELLSVELRALGALGIATPDVGAIDALAARDDALGFVYCWTGVGEGRVRARMFAPGSGIAEDPATGAACAALGGVLAEGLGDGSHHWIVEQGVEMGRPSELRLEVEVDGGRPIRSRVGGRAVVVMTGRIELSDRLGAASSPPVR